MIFAQSLEGGLRTRQQYRLDNGTQYWKTDYFGGADADPETPQAFLVEQEPSSLIRPHFHDASQFQVVVEGAGTLGHHELAPVTVHYAAAYTGYGPLVSDAGGLKYFTLRNRFAARPHFFPEDRAHLKVARRRNLTSALLGACQVPGPGLVTTETAIEAQFDGVAAWLCHLGPAAPLPNPPATPSRGELGEETRGDGRYTVVLSGYLHWEQALPAPSRMWSRLAVMWTGPTDPQPHLTAGAEGAHVLILQFPQCPDAAV